MTDASYLLAVNMSVAILLAAAFWLVSIRSERPASARWLAASYGIGSLYFAAEFVTPYMANPRAAGTMAFMSILLATAAFCAGIAIEFGRRLRWAAKGAIVVLGLAFYVLTWDMPRQSYARLYAYQAPLAALLIYCIASIWRRALVRGRLEALLLAVLAASALHFLAKPILANALGGTGETAGVYVNSAYALVSQATATVLSLGTALVSLAILIGRILTSATEKSEIDGLSGLYNRRGFERAGAQALAEADRQRRPVGLVMADIDHFKAINDRFGHAAGDETIRAFAELLSRAGAGHLVARTGGEEFAVILVGAETASARLFAEGVRTALANSSISALSGSQVTASFGVAEREAGEALSHLMSRADLALYAAKTAGRNCVCVAGPDQPAGPDVSSGSGRGAAGPVARRYRDISSTEK